MNRLAGILLAALAMAPSAHAQTSPNPFQNIQFYRDLGDLAELSAPFVSELGNNVEGSSVIRSSRREIEDTLRLSGEPFYLIELPMQLEPLTNRPVRVGPPRLMGVGSASANIIVSDALRPRLDAPPRPFGPDRTVFIIAQLRNNRLVWGRMPSEAVAQVRVQAAGVLANRQIALAQARADYGRVLEGLVDRVQRKLRDREQSELIQALYEDSRNRERALSEIRARMAFDLRQAQNAEAAVARIQSISSIISVGSAVAQLQAAAPGLPTEQLQQASTTQEALSIATIYAADSRGAVTTAETIINATGPASIQAAERLQSELIRVGVPPNLVAPPPRM